MPNFEIFDPSVKIREEMDEVPESERSSIIVDEKGGITFSTSSSVL